ncbi:tetratricopeptide repeat protein [Brachyspira pulli]|uniref:tetratricopeptide repeat protein n=1 Tax=Brachyspira pulli TaxID=310721 RepID=UPI0030057C19
MNKNLNTINNIDDIKNIIRDKFKLSLYEEAIEILDEALEKNYIDSEIYYIRGMAKQELKLYDGAIDDYNKVIELNPNANVSYCIKND